MLKKFGTIDLSVELPTVIKSLEDGIVELQEWMDNPSNKVDPYEKMILNKHIETYTQAIEFYKTKGRYAGLNYLYGALRALEHFENMMQYNRIETGYYDGLRKWDS